MWNQIGAQTTTHHPTEWCEPWQKNYERNTSGLHPDNHDPGDVEETRPETHEANSSPPLEDNTV